MDSKQVIQLLELNQHPEGGYYREIYRSSDSISLDAINQNNSGLRNLATSIYYLLESGQVSKLHRLKSDEIWYFHTGSPIYIICLLKAQISTILLGSDLDKGQVPQAIIKAGTIFGASPMNNHSYTLVGCMVAPGFDFTDFEFVKKEEIMKDYSDSFRLLINYIK